MLASFPLRSTCPANWTVRNALTVTVSGNGTVRGDIDGISCGGGTCTYRYPVGNAGVAQRHAGQGRQVCGLDRRLHRNGDSLLTGPRG